VAIEFDAQSGATSGSISATVLSVVMSPEGGHGRPMEENRQSFVVSQGFPTSSTTFAFTHRKGLSPYSRISDSEGR
jgi:hypothetical protein